jgi:hypothetical protein
VLKVEQAQVAVTLGHVSEVIFRAGKDWKSYEEVSPSDVLSPSFTTFREDVGLCVTGPLVWLETVCMTGYRQGGNVIGLNRSDAKQNPLGIREPISISFYQQRRTARLLTTISTSSGRRMILGWNV